MKTQKLLLSLTHMDGYMYSRSAWAIPERASCTSQASETLVTDPVVNV